MTCSDILASIGKCYTGWINFFEEIVKFMYFENATKFDKFPNFHKKFISSVKKSLGDFIILCGLLRIRALKSRSKRSILSLIAALG